ncbi:MAG TPA: ParB/RepB/Spo0J family partition protein [Longimicrobium sp.]|nr:ParB/RepB/Spo0J family partition protein [Longimicrobium sp.]
MFRPDELEPWPGLNPRMIFDPTEQAELDKSVRVRGIKQPILVHLREDGKSWIVMGERRWRSATNTGRMVPAVVGTFSEEEAFELALIENIQRANLNPIEEGRAFKRWLDQHPDADQYVLAEKIDKSQPYISFRLNLLRLPGNIQCLVSEGLVSKTQARDAFLPFAEIPEAVRGGWEPDEEGAEPPVYEEGQTPKVFDAVEMAVRVHYLGGGGKLNLPQLQAIIGAAALPHSKPLTPADADASEERPVFDASDHAKKCKCNGPRWMYRRWGNEQARCFGEYWQKKQDAAKRAQRAEQEERRKQEEARRKEAEERLGDDAPTVPAEDARRLFPDAVVLTDSTSDFRRMSLMVDTALIPASTVRVVKDWQASAAYSLICTDREAMNTALTAGREARAQLVARLTTERITQEREGAAKLDLRKPDVIAELLTTLPKVSDAFVATVAREHGLKGIPEHGSKLEQWLALDGKELQLFARALVLRIRAQTQEERQRMHDPISAEVNRLLLEQYNAHLDTLRSSVQLPRPAFAERLDDAVARFYEAHNPLAQQAREGGLSESAGEAIHALAGTVEEIRTIRREALEAGEDPTTLTIEDVEERFTDLEAAYQRQHGPQAEEQDKGAPEGAPAPAGNEAPAPAEEEQQPAPAADEAPAKEDDPADELAAARKKARRGRDGK